MKILFIASGNHEMPSPVVNNQAEALMSEGVEIEWFLLKGKGIKGYLRNVKPLRQYLCKHPYDAIHAHYSLSAFVASLSGAKPLVVSLMGSDVKAAGWYKFIIRLFARLFRWKAIIVKSNDMFRDLGIKRAVVIPNGVNMDRFKPMDKSECQRRLGWDLSYNQKNDKKNTESSADTDSILTGINQQSANEQDSLLTSAQSRSKDIVTQYPSDDPEKNTKNNSSTNGRVLHVLFPADAKRPEKDYALAEAAVERVRELESERIRGVELHAFENTPNEETPYWYNAADVVLMTSKWEGSPNAIKEAMACSRPIVATNVGDIAERLHDLEGCFVVNRKELESERISELANALVKAMEFKETKGRERIIADGLDAHEINKKLIEVYKVK